VFLGESHQFVSGRRENPIRPRKTAMWNSTLSGVAKKATWTNGHIHKAECKGGEVASSTSLGFIAWWWGLQEQKGLAWVAKLG